MPLTEQQKAFCHEYLKDYTVCAAMGRAGYAQKTADKNGYLLLRKPEIAAYLKQIINEVRNEAKLTSARVLGELSRIAFSDVASFYRWSKTTKKYVLKPPEEWTPEQRAAVAEYKPGQYIKLWSKDGALDKLGKHFKLFTDIDASTTNFNLLPPLKFKGKEVIFNIGQPITEDPKTN